MFKLIEKLQKIDAVTVTSTDEDNVYAVRVDLGSGYAGKYDGGYWGDCAITNDNLALDFLYGKLYDDDVDSNTADFGEGTVHLDYVEGSGLAYTGDLDAIVADKLEEITSGLLTCTGSEQGMQGHDYLSVDVGEA